MPPSSVVTIIVVVPFAIPVTFPSLSTIAISESIVDHVIFLFFALSGSIIAVNFFFSPTSNFIEFVSNFIPVTLISSPGSGSGVGSTCEFSVTITSHLAVFPPSSVVTVIVEVPSANPVTIPLLLTSTILELLEDQIMFLLSAFCGSIIAVN